jgi:hypothetical protein
MRGSTGREIRTRRCARRALVAIALCAAGALLPTAAGAAPVTAGFRDFSYGTTVTAPTGQKPESKLWFNDGRWWAVLFNTTSRRFEIYGFNKDAQATNAWTTTGVAVDGRRTAEADVKWVSNGKLYVVTHIAEGATTTDNTVNVKRFGYAPGATPGTGTYTLETTKTVANGAIETAVLERDSLGKLWVTWTAPNAAGGRSVFVTHTVASDTDFVAPFVLPVPNANNLNADDISTILATGGKVGVLWSNQATNELRFAVHADTASDQTWTSKVLCAATKCPDDHLNIKALEGSGTGEAFAIVKTSLNDVATSPASAPLIVLYHIDMSTLAVDSHTVWTVGDNATRGIVLLDREHKDAYAFSAAPCCSGGVVYMKRAPFANLTFPTGPGTPFIQSTTDTKINNPTSTKQSLDSTTGLLVLAGDDGTRFYLHNFLDLGASAPPPPPPPPPPGGTTVTLNAVADTYAAADAAGPFGTSTSLFADSSPLKVTYLRFDLSSLAGRTITGARLTVRTTTNSASGSPGPDLVKVVADNTWTEGGLLFANRPTPGAQVGQFGATTSNTAFTVTLATPPVAAAAGGPLSLAIDPVSSDAFYITSRETATPPQLEVTVQ